MAVQPSMPGVYLHIPFCRKACTYCDFHFSTGSRLKQRVLEAMLRELDLRAPAVQGPADTVYFGGGTPSLLTPAEIGAFLSALRQGPGIAAGAEVTLEANPDDITAETLAAWRDIGITRLSLGTQSFREDRLRFMGRAHTAEQALRSIDLIADAGFTSWTIDLIYGLPGMTLAEWDEQLRIALDHGMPHLSAYCLTVEPRTALARQVERGEVLPPGDADQSAQFQLLMECMAAAGMEHYEISNFALPGQRSRHNSAYWAGLPYLGIGPSAHSFSGTHRRWNIANNARYVQALEAGEDAPHDTEETTPHRRSNESILTGLRTGEGLDPHTLDPGWGPEQWQLVARHISGGHMVERNGRLVLTNAGKQFADRIAASLFIDDDR
jgi:oxygen-independent coproporphyrinogen-3 oxidase